MVRFFVATLPVNRFVWTMARFWIRLRSGRNSPRHLPDPVWYFTFGSNMNERLFRERRHMTPIESKVARLDGYRLCFTVAGGRRPGASAPANIRPAPGAAVYGVLYLLALRKFGFEATTTDTSGIFADREVDAVVITTRHDSHALQLGGEQSGVRC